ncbi:MAG: MATE family efflux transporter [Clostridia bacterium]|nr:MATE family efflux transporter [Clostridia bacterium]
MLVQALYNIVDSVFVAQVSENALTAVTLAFPIQNLMIAIGSGTAVGVNALLSKSLGERDQTNADRAANAGLLLTLPGFLLMLVFGLFFATPFIAGQIDPVAVTDPTDIAAITTGGTAYLQVCCCFSFGLFFQIMCERLLQSTGRTTLSMISQISGAVINMILDPILIFGLLGLPSLGVAGAAIATVIGQCCAATIGLVLNLRHNRDIHLSFKAVFRPHAATIGRIYAVGAPSILMMSIGSVMTYMMNRILAAFASAQAVFGVYFKLQSFFFMPLFGLNNGLIPIIAFNYGAKNKARVKDSMRFAMILAVSIMVVGTIIFHVVPTLLLSFFNASPEMVRIGVPALRIISLSFPIAAVCIVLGSTFQAFSKGVYSLIVSIMRQLVVLIPAAWLLSLSGEVTNIWWAFLFAEIMSLTVTLLCYRRLHRKIISTL